MIHSTHQVKVTNHHLERGAGVYVRQSSLQQVRQHTASGQLQYELRARAVSFGWRDEQVRIYDADQGLSGSGKDQRDDFSKLVTDVGLGQIGIVIAFDATRLARNNTDWHRLLDMCGVCDTLVADLDGVYDVSLYNDRLLLGLKGTMSEAEHHLIRTRMIEGMERKAQEGALRKRLPVGLVYDEYGSVQLHPDERVQRAIALVFEKFQELGTAHAVYRFLQEERIQMPVRRYKWKMPVEWQECSYESVRYILINPRYAGAYVYGRTKTVRRADKGGHITEQRVKVPVSEWKVVKKEQHPGYITWAQFEENQHRLEKNVLMGRPDEGSEVLRSGRGLLQGLLRCGVCGRKMRTAYPKNGESVRHDCSMKSRMVDGAGQCQSVGGARLEEAVVDAVLNALEPAAMRIAIASLDEIDREHDAVLHQLESQLEEARYLAGRAQRQYDAVEPENRNVVRTLERQWNNRLEEVAELEEQIEYRKSLKPEGLSTAERQRILDLGVDIRRIWNAPTTDHRVKKQLLQAAFESIFVKVDRENNSAHLTLIWEGGETTDLAVSIPPVGYHPIVTPDQVVKDIRKMATVMTDKQIATALNCRGVRTATGLPFSVERVRTIRQTNNIPRCDPSHWQNGKKLYSAREAARELGVSSPTIFRWLKEGFLEGVQIVPYAPWQISIPESVRLKVAEKVPPEWLSMKQVAERCSVGKKTVLSWVRSQKVEAMIGGVGRRKGVRINPDSLKKELSEPLFDERK